MYSSNDQYFSLHEVASCGYLNHHMSTNCITRDPESPLGLRLTPISGKLESTHSYLRVCLPAAYIVGDIGRIKTGSDDQLDTEHETENSVPTGR